LAGCTVVVDEATVLHPARSEGPPLASIAERSPTFNLEEHAITATDGTKLYALAFWKPGAKRSILYFGGNLFQVRRTSAWVASVMAPLNANLLFVDHRGTGRSEGEPTFALMQSDALMSYDYFCALPTVAQVPLVVHGQSLGSFVAGYIAANRRTDGLVLESSASTTESWVALSMPSLARSFVRTKISPALQGAGNLQYMPTLDEPVLFLVGKNDRTTPSAMSRQLFEAAHLPRDQKSLLIVDRAGHDNVLQQAEAIAAYDSFVQTITPRSRVCSS